VKRRDVDAAIREEAYAQYLLAQARVNPATPNPEPTRPSLLLVGVVGFVKWVVFGVIWVVHHLVRLMTWAFLAAGSWLKDEIARAKHAAEFTQAQRSVQVAPTPPVSVREVTPASTSEPTPAEQFVAGVAECAQCEAVSTVEWISPTGTTIATCDQHQMSEAALFAAGWRRTR
jgi:hypothetical protein